MDAMNDIAKVREQWRKLTAASMTESNWLIKTWCYLTQGFSRIFKTGSNLAHYLHNLCVKLCDMWCYEMYMANILLGCVASAILPIRAWTEWDAISQGHSCGPSNTITQSTMGRRDLGSNSQSPWSVSRHNRAAMKHGSSIANSTDMNSNLNV